jgi:hypothetical protein
MVNERSDYEDIYRSHGSNAGVPDGRRCECSEWNLISTSDHNKFGKFRDKYCKFINDTLC